MNKNCFLALIPTALLLTVTFSVSSAQSSPESPGQLRVVRGNTIISPELPTANLIFAEAFRYVGGQQVNLYSMADAEQHLFVKSGRNGVVDAFYWVQFERRVPSDHHSYNYAADHTTDVGGLNFVYDVKSWPDFAANLLEDPASDGAAISHLLAKNNLKFPKRAARVRMFHLPTADRRSELMIIYGETLSESSEVPVRKEGVDLARESPAVAQKLLDDLKKQLTINRK